MREIQDHVTAAKQQLRKLEEEIREYDEIDCEDLADEEKDAFIRLRRRAVKAKNVVDQREFE